MDLILELSGKQTAIIAALPNEAISSATSIQMNVDYSIHR